MLLPNKVTIQDNRQTRSREEDDDDDDDDERKNSDNTRFATIGLADASVALAVVFASQEKTTTTTKKHGQKANKSARVGDCVKDGKK